MGRNNTGSETQEMGSVGTVLEAGYQRGFLARFFLCLIIAMEDAGSPPTLP